MTVRKQCHRCHLCSTCRQLPPLWLDHTAGVRHYTNVSDWVRVQVPVLVQTSVSPHTYSYGWCAELLSNNNQMHGKTRRERRVFHCFLLLLTSFLFSPQIKAEPEREALSTCCWSESILWIWDSNPARQTEAQRSASGYREDQPSPHKEVCNYVCEYIYMHSMWI